MNKFVELICKIDWKDFGVDDFKILQGNGIIECDWQLWQQLELSKCEDGMVVFIQNDFFNVFDDVIKQFLLEDKYNSISVIVDF